MLFSMVDDFNRALLGHSCRVPKPFSKRNEDTSVIQTQIAAFRDHNILLSI
jgi:hypothetical protein